MPKSYLWITINSLESKKIIKSYIEGRKKYIYLTTNGKIILKALNKTVARMNEDAKTCWFDFGWIIQQENNSVELRTVYSLYSNVIHGVPINVQTSFEGGDVKIKFDIMAPTVLPIVHDADFGSESNLMNLKEALIQLFTKTDPKVSILEFKGLDGIEEFKFKKSFGGINGPNGVWKMNQQDKMNIARMWLSPYLTDKGKSFIFNYSGLGDIDADSTKISIIEDPTSGKKDCCKRIAAQFVVNGGNDSTVLSFSPTVSWWPDSGGGGASSAGASGAGSPQLQANQKTDTFKERREKASQTIKNVTVPENLWNNVTPEEHAKVLKEASTGEAKVTTGAALGRAAPFEADLKIYGDPFWASPFDFISKSISVLFLNPYTPMESGNRLEWLAMPKCNATLSNKNYMILGINHQIQNGQFVTTFKLKLNVPNVDSFSGETLGDGCGNEKFDGSPIDGKNPQPASGISKAIDANDISNRDAIT
jgi:predicted transcriptional regulator